MSAESDRIRLAYAHGSGRHDLDQMSPAADYLSRRRQSLLTPESAENQIVLLDYGDHRDHEFRHGWMRRDRTTSTGHVTPMLPDLLQLCRARSLRQL